MIERVLRVILAVPLVACIPFLVALTVLSLPVNYIKSGDAEMTDFFEIALDFFLKVTNYEP